MKFQYNDGGRVAYGYAKGRGRDCAVRAIAIVTGFSYDTVYTELHYRGRDYFRTSRLGWIPSMGVLPEISAPFLNDLGFLYKRTKGSGLRMLDLPETGRFVVSTRNHLTAVVDGVVHDTWNSMFTGKSGRLVYGYYWRD